LTAVFIPVTFYEVAFKLDYLVNGIKLF